MYTILPLSSKVQKQIDQLRPAEKKKLRQAFIDIENNPYSAPGGKIEKFKGDLSYLGWHYALAYSYRIHYEIYEDNKGIEITYIGPHPKY